MKEEKKNSSLLLFLGLIGNPLNDLVHQTEIPLHELTFSGIL